MRSLVLTLLVLPCLQALIAAQSAPAQRLLLSGGHVQVNTAEAPRRADVLIVGDRIEAVGEGLKAEGAEVCDVTGLVIAPAFVDAANLGLLDESAFRGGASDLAADMLEAHDSLARERLNRVGLGFVYVDLPLMNAARGPVGCVASADPTAANPAVLERLAGLSFGIGTRQGGEAGRLGRSGDAAAVGEAFAAARRYRKSFEKHEKDLKEFEAKQAKSEKAEKSEKTEKTEKPEKTEKSEKTEKPEKPEKPEKKPLPPQQPKTEEAHEAVLRVLDHKTPLRIEAHWREDIEAALDLATKQGLRLVLLGGGEADQLADKLAAAKACVVLGPAQPIGMSPLQAPQRRANVAALLDAAGVSLAFMSAGAQGYRYDSAPLIAALHVAEGLSEAAALRGLTLGAAEALGWSGRSGSVEAGRMAFLQIGSAKPSLSGGAPVKMVFGTRVVTCGKKSS